MKHFKIFVSLMLVCMMMLTIVSGTVFAEGETGTITINNAKAGAEYRVYKILDLLSYDVSLKAYKYRVNDTWRAFFRDNADAKTIFSWDKDTDLVTVKPNAGTPTAEEIQKFADSAIKYALLNFIQPTQEKAATDADNTKNDVTVVFTELELGYYLVQSSIGTVLSLDTTHPDAEMYDKNAVTTLTKSVDKPSVNIGDTVEFTIQVKLENNADEDAKYGFINDLVVHDIMDSTLTLNKGSFKLTKQSGDDKPVNLTAGADKDYTIEYDVSDGETNNQNCTFHILFTNEMYKAGDLITIKYKAVLNETAVIGNPGNKNESHATYGGHSTPKSEVKVYTGKLIIDKYDETDATKKLSGAQFVISKTIENDVEVYYKANPAPTATIVESSEEGGEPVTIEPYTTENIVKEVTWVEDINEATVLTTNSNGEVIFAGIAAGTYSLEEIKAPDGFNLIKPQTFTIAATENLNANPPVNAYITTRRVANKKGVLLPETGGVGTTLFIVFGSIAAIAAGVVLVARRRMKLIGSDI